MFPNLHLTVLGTFAVFLLFLPHHGRSALVNRTIDDSAGDSVTGFKPVYVPAASGAWKDQTCADCTIRPDVRQMFMTTFTAVTYSPELHKNTSVGFSLRFNGTAIYVFLVLVPDVLLTETICAFTLDDEQATPFRSAGFPSLQSGYSQMVYNRTDLAPREHELNVSIPFGLASPAYLNFDYAIYTYDDMISSDSTANFTTPTATETTNTDSPSPSSSRNKPSSLVVGAAVGGSIAGLILISAPIALALYLRRSKKRRESLTRPPSPKPPEPLPPALVEGLPDAPTGKASTLSSWLTFGRAGRQKKSPDLEESESAPSRDQARPTAVDEQRPSSSGEAAGTNASAAAPPGLASTALQGNSEGEVEGRISTPLGSGQDDDHIGQRVENMEEEMQEHMSQAQQLQQEIDVLQRNSSP